VANANLGIAEFDTTTNKVVGGTAIATLPFTVKCASTTGTGINKFEVAFDRCLNLDPSRYVRGGKGAGSKGRAQECW